jgi:hypothetical protein
LWEGGVWKRPWNGEPAWDGGRRWVMGVAGEPPGGCCCCWGCGGRGWGGAPVGLGLPPEAMAAATGRVRVEWEGLKAAATGSLGERGGPWAFVMGRAEKGSPFSFLCRFYALSCLVFFSNGSSKEM